MNDWILEELNKQNTRSVNYGYALAAIAQTKFRQRLADQITRDVESMNQWLFLRKQPLKISSNTDYSNISVRSGEISVLLALAENSDRLEIHYKLGDCLDPFNKTINLSGRFRTPRVAEEVIGNEVLIGPVEISEAILSELIPAINALPVPIPEWLKDGLREDPLENQ